VTYFRGQTASLVDQMILLGATVKLCCRLIAIRVPEEVANRRRQQARDKAKKKGREPSAEYLELLGWSLFVTNGKSEDLTWKAVVVLYRARWQIVALIQAVEVAQPTRTWSGGCVGAGVPGGILRETAGGSATALDTSGDGVAYRGPQPDEGGGNAGR
jgi:hypothetical protein